MCISIRKINIQMIGFPPLLLYFFNTLRSRVYKRIKIKHDFCSTTWLWFNEHLFRHPGLPRSRFLSVALYSCWKPVAAKSFIHHQLVYLLLGQLPLFVYWTIGQFRASPHPHPLISCTNLMFAIRIRNYNQIETWRHAAPPTKTTRRKSAFVYTRHTQVLCTLIVLYYPPPKIYEMMMISSSSRSSSRGIIIA